jgi:hypothetical protein
VVQSASVEQEMAASFTLVGSGICFLTDLTKEAETYITQSDKVLYLVNEPAMKAWIEKSARFAESLDPLYAKHPRRGVVE